MCDYDSTRKGMCGQTGACLLTPCDTSGWIAGLGTFCGLNNARNLCSVKCTFYGVCRDMSRVTVRNTGKVIGFFDNINCPFGGTCNSGFCINTTLQDCTQAGSETGRCQLNRTEFGICIEGRCQATACSSVQPKLEFCGLAQNGCSARCRSQGSQCGNYTITDSSGESVNFFHGLTCGVNKVCERDVCVCEKGFEPSSNACTPAICPANSSRKDNAKICTCDNGFSGAVTATRSSPYYTGSCNAAPCPANSSRQQGATNCTCNAGFTGNIQATDTSPFFTGQCVQSQCTCQNGVAATGNACTSNGAHICSSCIEGFKKDSSNHCEAVDCPGIATGKVSTGCSCPAGYRSTIQGTTSDPYYSGACNKVDCPINSSGAQGLPGGCACDLGFHGTITKTAVAPDYFVGTCHANSCTCGNGTAESGAGCTSNNASICTSCNTGYNLRLRDRSCQQNSCTCRGGTAASGIRCTSNNTEICESCDAGYRKVGNNCSAVPCPANSTGTNLPTDDCKCIEGYSGTITKQVGDPFYRGLCTLAVCPANSSRKDNAKICTCDNGFSGAVTATRSSPYYTGSCNAAPCPANSSRQQGATNCTCNAGFTGNIQATDTSPFFTGQCVQSQCTCQNGVAATGNACTSNGAHICSSCIEGFKKDSSNHCEAVDCPGIATGKVSTGCSCPAGYRSTIQGTTSDPYYSGACNKVDCPINSSGAQGLPGGCACDLGFHGTITKTAVAPDYFVGKCDQNVCKCSGGTPVTGNNCTTHDEDKCDTCNAGYKKSENACVPVICPPTSSGTNLAANDCVCNAGYNGSITASGVDPYYNGTCNAIHCPSHSAGTDLPTDDCVCKAGFSGTIKKKIGAPFYTGSCNAVACPTNSSNPTGSSQQGVPFGCLCNAGFSGTITKSESSPFYTGRCVQNVCTCTNGTPMTQEECIVHGEENCAACDQNFVKRSMKCEPKFCTKSGKKYGCDIYEGCQFASGIVPFLALFTENVTLEMCNTKCLENPKCHSFVLHTNMGACSLWPSYFREKNLNRFAGETTYICPNRGEEYVKDCDPIMSKFEDEVSFLARATHGSLSECDKMCKSNLKCHYFSWSKSKSQCTLYEKTAMQMVPSSDDTITYRCPGQGEPAFACKREGLFPLFKKCRCSMDKSQTSADCFEDQYCYANGICNTTPRSKLRLGDTGSHLTKHRFIIHRVLGIGFVVIFALLITLFLVGITKKISDSYALYFRVWLLNHPYWTKKNLSIFSLVLEVIISASVILLHITTWAELTVYGVEIEQGIWRTCLADGSECEDTSVTFHNAKELTISRVLLILLSITTCGGLLLNILNLLRQQRVHRNLSALISYLSYPLILVLICLESALHFDIDHDRIDEDATGFIHEMNPAAWISLFLVAFMFPVSIFVHEALRYSQTQVNRLSQRLSKRIKAGTIAQRRNDVISVTAIEVGETDEMKTNKEAML
eukprot:g2639.t1